MNISRQIRTVISRGRPVLVTFDNGDVVRMTIARFDGRVFYSTADGAFDKRSVLTITSVEDNAVLSITVEQLA